MKERTILEVLNWTVTYFEKMQVGSPRLDAELLLAHTLRLSRIDLYLNLDRVLNGEEWKTFKELIERRVRHEPCAYILGKKEFMSLEFKVTPAVLIPRPETELLVEEVVRIGRREEGGRREDLVIVDIGTGCGNIAISLLRYLGTGLTIYATDISREALLVAKENIEAFGFDGKILLLEGDLFGALEGLSLNGRVDIIVSNPPYIAQDEWEDLPIEVRGFEPRIALDGGKDGIKFYSRIIREAGSLLKEGGFLALEMGIAQSAIIRDIFDSCNLSPRIIKDYQGIERIIIGEKQETANNRAQVSALSTISLS